MKRKSELLQAAYDVCRILLQERDLPTLLQGMCDRICANGLHQSTLLVLFDQDSGGVITAESGLGERVAPVMAELRQGRLPECGVRALDGEGFASVVCDDCQCSMCVPGSDDAADCALSAPLRCTSSLTGFLTVRLPRGVVPQPFELRILADVAETVSQALRQLFAMEASRDREQELKRIEERYELALHATQAGLWDWNIKTGEMYASPDHWDLLDYRSGDEGTTGRFIHPDDKELVLAVLNDHLTGKTDEYLIEYRVKEQEGEWGWFLDRGRVVERDENNMPVRMTGTHQNITQQKKQEQTVAIVQQQLHDAVDRERSFLQTVIDSAGDPVIAIDLEYTVLLINQAAVSLIQERDGTPMQGQKCYRLFHGADIPCQDRRFPCPIRAVMHSWQAAKLIHNPYHGNGVNNTFELEISPLKDGSGALYGIIEVARDITDRLRIEEELRSSQSHLYRLAHHDTLTGLPNRLLFRDRLNHAVSKAKRSNASVALLFLDLDHFKVINDTLGHDVGDVLLTKVARRFQRQCRQSDTVARLGGDEFVFILEDIGKPEDASVVARKIMAALARPVAAGGHTLNVTTSIGIALYPDDSGEIEGVLKCADIALYAAKKVGRSNYQFYQDSITQNGGRPQMEKAQFRHALECQQMSLAYLPQYQLATGRVTGFEALLRWHHPEMGVLLPSAFIVAADECDMLAEVTRWTIEEVCRALQSWQEQGLVCLPVTIHLATRQLLEPDFLAMVGRAVKHHAIAESLITFALRESAIAGATALIAGLLRQLDHLGFGLAVDNAGAETCPLSRLQQWPIRRMAISRILIGDLDKTEQSVPLVSAIIRLGQTLGLQVLADGVERDSQLQTLRRCGCDQVQGLLLASPLSAEKTPSMLALSQKDD